MNKPRRKELSKALQMIIEQVQEEEQESFDNMPEGLQSSELGEKIEENAEWLYEIYDNLNDMESELEDIING